MNFTQLLKARRERERDAAVREQLGLRRAGLQYTTSTPEEWRSPPRERFIDLRGRVWVKWAPADYRRLHPGVIDPIHSAASSGATHGEVEYV